MNSVAVSYTQASTVTPAGVLAKQPFNGVLALAPGAQQNLVQQLKADGKIDNAVMAFYFSQDGLTNFVTLGEYEQYLCSTPLKDDKGQSLGYTSENSKWAIKMDKISLEFT